MTSLLTRAVELGRWMLNAGRRNARPVKYRPQIESLESRVALSRSPALLDAPRANSGRHGLGPEKRELTVTVQVTLPPGYGWFVEVRGANGKWSWKGPFPDKNRARALFRRRGIRVRGAQLVVPEEPVPELPAFDFPAFDFPVYDGPGYDSPGYDSPGYDPDPGGEEPYDPTPPPQQIVGYEVMFWGVDPWGWGGWRSGTPREIFTTYSAAQWQANWRNSNFPYNHTVQQVVFQPGQATVDDYSGRIYPLY